MRPVNKIMKENVARGKRELLSGEEGLQEDGDGG